jgi:hypothetical protein
VILSHISSGRNKVSLTAVEQIIKAFPAINAEWILTGKGQMYSDGLDDEIAEELDKALIVLEDEHKRYVKSMESKLLALKRTIEGFKG